MEDFTNIIDQGEQFPLHIHLGFGAESEVVQALVNAKIGKDRLDDRQAPGIDRLAVWIIDPGFHTLDQVGRLAVKRHRKRAPGSVQLAQAICAQRASSAILRTSTINIIDPIAVRLPARTSFQKLVMRTKIDLPGLIKAEVGKSEGLFFGSFETLLIGKARVTGTKINIGDIGIEALNVEKNQIGVAEIIAVSSKGFVRKKVRAPANLHNILLGSGQHGHQILMIL